MAPGDPRAEASLILAMTAGDAAAAQTFKTRHAALLEQICGSVTPGERSKTEAYRDLVASGDFPALFAGYDGKGSWRTFVIAAVVNRFLFPRLLRRIGEDPLAHAADFVAFFQDGILRAIRHVTIDRGLEDDAFQWIVEQMLRDRGEQLRIFAAQALTPGFVFCKLKYLARDFLNSRDAPAEGRKRTLPDCLKDAPAFEQDVFKQFYWWRASSTQVALLAMRHRHPEVTERSVREARAGIEAVLASHGGLFGADPDMNTPGGGALPPQPFEDEESAAFRQALYAAAKTLTARETLYLLKRLQGKPAGIIAKEMRIAANEAYALADKAMDKLRRMLTSHPAAQARIASITGNDAHVEAGPAVRHEPTVQ